MFSVTSGGSWKQLGKPGITSDVGIGADGSVWIIGRTKIGAGGNAIMRWNGTAFTRYEGAATRIAVGEGEHVASVNELGNVYVKSGNPWKQLGNPGIASDVGIGTDGTVWIITRTQGGNGGNGIMRWDGCYRRGESNRKVIVSCDEGDVLVGGGGSCYGYKGGWKSYLVASVPEGNGWKTSFRNITNGEEQVYGYSYAICCKN